MPTMHETIDPCGYYDDSWSRADYQGSITAKSLASLLEELETPFVRWPIRNREERTPILALKRAIIHERDGNMCRICGTGGHRLTVDHIIPRSAFLPAQLRIADRSDNLISACWDCNADKSNYEHPQRKRLGVTAACWGCLNDYPIDDEWQDDSPRPTMNHMAFCGRCGITNIPSLRWVL